MVSSLGTILLWNTVMIVVNVVVIAINNQNLQRVFKDEKVN
jgi:hypothetical protein